MTSQPSPIRFEHLLFFFSCLLANSNFRPAFWKRQLTTRRASAMRLWKSKKSNRYTDSEHLTPTMRKNSNMNRPLALICMLLLTVCSLAQQDAAPVEPMDQTPLFHVRVTSRSTNAGNYRHRGGSNTADFKGTALMPEASGRAKVDSKAGRLEISAEFSRFQPATKFGPEYLTYVLWAITPEGRSVNLG